MSHTCWSGRISSCCGTTLCSRYFWKLTRFITSPAPRRRGIINTIRSRRSKHRSLAPSICLHVEAVPGENSAGFDQRSVWRPEVHPQPETYRGAVNTLGPRACYDEGKRAAETLFMDYHRMHGVNIRIVRIFNTYGPRMHPYDGRVVSNFIRQAMAGQDITIYGDGSQTRSFCYRDDLIEGIIKMMDAPDDCIGPINLGNPDEFTILQLAELVIELTRRSKSKLIYKPALPDDPAKRRPDITLACQKLNWQPQIKLREGLQKTIEWLRSIDISQYRAPTPNY